MYCARYGNATLSGIAHGFTDLCEIRESSPPCKIYPSIVKANYGPMYNSSSRIRVSEYLFREDREACVPRRGPLKFPGVRVSEQMSPEDREACVPRLGLLTKGRERRACSLRYPASFDARRVAERGVSRTAKLAFRDTVSHNSPGAMSLKLVPPGPGNLCPETRTPKGKLVFCNADS